LQQENLAKYFITTASKYLSAVEINNYRSNRFEFSEASKLKHILGSKNLHNVPTKFLYLSDDDTEELLGTISWSKVREDNPSHSEEFRFNYSENMAISEANEGDLLVNALCPDKSVMIIIAKSGTTAENQLIWLFGIAEDKFKINTDLASKSFNFSTRFILRGLGVNV